VLTSDSTLSNGPAGVFHRRPFLSALLGLATAVTVLLVFATALSPACAERREPDVDGARNAARRAVRLLRPTAPYQAKYIERLAADAEAVTAAERYAPRWRTIPGRPEAAWLRTVVAAGDAVKALRRQQGQARSRYLALLASTREELLRARAEMREAGMGRREAAAMARATTSAKTAEKLAAAGDWARASEKLEVAKKMTGVVHSSWGGLHARFSDPRLRREWQRVAEETIASSRETGGPAVIVDKLRRRLYVYIAGERVASFAAELGANGLRRKEHSGDSATPEGKYLVEQVKQGRQTKYYKALLVNYPNEQDQLRFWQGKQRGTIPARATIGGLIEIHGGGGDGRDWTDGCVALTNEDMDRLFDYTSVGTPVTIVGTYER
jgi:lipoprotein-anchoring transpeptidase ErfK/SrfK